MTPGPARTKVWPSRHCIECGRPVAYGPRCQSCANRAKARGAVAARTTKSAVPAGLRRLSPEDATEAAALVKLISGAVVGR